MNYSLGFNRSLEQMKKHANDETISTINEFMEIINSIKPSSPYYPKNANMIELINIEAFNLFGNASVFVMRNINGEVKELSAKFTSVNSVNRQIENDIYDIFIKECSGDTLASLKIGKSIPVGILTHHTSGRANRDFALVSKYSTFAKRDPDQFVVFYATNTTCQNSLHMQTDESDNESSAV